MTSSIAVQFSRNALIRKCNSYWKQKELTPKIGKNLAALMGQQLLKKIRLLPKHEARSSTTLPGHLSTDFFQVDGFCIAKPRGTY